MLLKNTTLYSIGIIIPKAASFLLLPVYTRYLSPEEYGIVQSMHVLSAILAIINTLAIDRSIFRLYYDYNTHEAKKSYLGTIAITIIVISFLILLLLFIARSFISTIFISIPFFPFFIYAIMTAFLSTISLIPKTYFQVNDNADKFILFSIAEFVLTTSMILYFVVHNGMGAEGMLLGNLIGVGLLVPFYLAVLFNIITLQWDKDIFFNSIKYSLPMVFGLLSAWILNLSDRVFLERFKSIYDVGIYSLAYKISDILTVFAAAASQAFTPLFFKIANRKENIDGIKNELFKYNKILSVLILFISMVISIFSKEIFLILGDNYHAASTLVPIIITGSVFNQVASLYNRSFYQVKKTFQPTLIGLFAAILNIVLNFVLIPIYGSYGAAISTLFSFLVLFILIYNISKKHYFIPVSWNSLLPLFIFYIATIIFVSSTDIQFFISLLLKTFLILIFIILDWYLNRDSIFKILFNKVRNSLSPK